MTWERRILRKIFGPKREQGEWRIRSNQNVYKSPDIVTEIKITRLERLGHLIRMDGTSIPKNGIQHQTGRQMWSWKIQAEMVR
jgi:hypothetical protein